MPAPPMYDFPPAEPSSPEDDTDRTHHRKTAPAIMDGAGMKKQKKKKKRRPKTTRFPTGKGMVRRLTTVDGTALANDNTRMSTASAGPILSGATSSFSFAAGAPIDEMAEDYGEDVEEDAAYRPVSRVIDVGVTEVIALHPDDVHPDNEHTQTLDQLAALSASPASQGSARSPLPRSSCSDDDIDGPDALVTMRGLEGSLQIAPAGMLDMPDVLGGSMNGSMSGRTVHLYHDKDISPEGRRLTGPFHFPGRCVYLKPSQAPPWWWNSSLDTT